MARSTSTLVLWVAFYLLVAPVAVSYTQPAFKGMSLTPWSENVLFSAGSDQSIANMAAIGVDTVALNFWAFQDDQNATDIQLDFNYFSASEASLVHAIDEIHSHGMKVLLKPNVDLRNGAWRGTINPSTAWFNEYEEFMTYWGDFAEDNGVEGLSIGTEYKNTESWDASWRGVASSVRSVYSGPITYSANHDSYSSVTWWDDLDYVGIDAYFPLSSQDEPSLSALTAAWQSQASSIEAWRTGQGLSQPVIFAEVGYRSVDGNLATPWDFSGSGPVDLQEQEDAYRALLSVMTTKDWFDGAFWWNWETDPNAGGATDDGFTPQNKPAQDVVAACYLDDDCGGSTGGATERTVLYSWENGLEGWFVPSFATHPASVAQSTSGATDDTHSLAVSETVASAGANHFSWNAAVVMTGAERDALSAALMEPENFLLEVDITYDTDSIPQNPASWMNGAIAIQDDSDWYQVDLVTTTGQSDHTLRISLPLSSWAGLSPGSNSYLMVLAMNGDWGAGTATLFYDNLSLVDLDPDLPTGLLGDYNDNGEVDAADYTAWRDALTAGNNTLLNDPTPGTVDESDFLYWRDHFGEMLGSGAGQAAVPEPAAFWLAIVGTVAGVTIRKRWL